MKTWNYADTKWHIVHKNLLNRYRLNSVSLETWQLALFLEMVKMHSVLLVIKLPQPIELAENHLSILI